MQDPDSKHVVVVCRGQFYWFDVLDDNSDLIMTEKDIALNLQTIVDDAQHTPIQEAAKGALGVLSTENRKVWSRMRDVLLREEGSNNADSLGIVDSALFVVCLDYTEPTNAADLCQNMLCGISEVEKGVQIGTCTNRWYDKLQIIVCKNGSAGINFEHTGVDGHTVLRFASDVYTDTILRFARTINGQAPSLWASTSPDPSKRDPDSFGDVSTTPHKLEWDMTPELSIAVRFAETRLADLIQQNEFQTIDFAAYGKNFMTSMGFSPDAFVQMAFQAAYYGLYGRVECTYEPAMTKIFLHGRTEAIRSVTTESVEFVQTFWGEHPTAQKIEALKKACQAHTSNTRECAKAQGCDRHLYALYSIWQRAHEEESTEVMPTDHELSSNGYSSPSIASEPNSPSGRISPSPSHSLSPTPAHRQLPSLFSDGGWAILNTTIISTSNCGNPSLRQFGFGPTSGDGFGIGYIIKDDGISICASSKHRQTKRFVHALESYLLEIRRLLKSQRKGAATSPKASRAREASMGRKGSMVRGRPIGADAVSKISVEQAIVEDSDGDELGGCEYFFFLILRFPPHFFGFPTFPHLFTNISSLALSLPPTTLNRPSLAPKKFQLTNPFPPPDGFFDAGMLLQALKARNEDPDNGESHPVRRREVGKKLRLSDY